MRRTFILTVDLTKAPEWQVIALQRQMADWLEANPVLSSEDSLIILPAPGDTKLYWLEGEAKDITELTHVRDRLRPVLEVSLDLKTNRLKLKDPNLDKQRRKLDAYLRRF